MTKGDADKSKVVPDENTPVKPNRQYSQSYLKAAASVIKSYHVPEPFHLFLKRYFSLNRKHGSRDRKIITSLCYAYFRVGFGVSTQIPLEEKIVLGVFLCNRTDSPLLQSLSPELNAAISLPTEKKLLVVNEKFDINALFPFPDEISNQIELHPFLQSFLIQPKLFIRIRPHCKDVVIEKLNKGQTGFEEISDNCLAFTNNEKIDKILETDKEVVIQDYNSQRTVKLLKPVAGNFSNPVSVWDCCAGSGGKSILAYDMLKNINLTVTDKRKEILSNLEKRLKLAGIADYHMSVADLEKASTGSKELFNIIIADVPCSGSGTWARIPEQLLLFKKNNIARYVELQQHIINNILPNLGPGGYLLYITCSVFERENEENVDEFQKKHHLKTVMMEYFKGYEMQSDTMFAALLQKDS